MEKDDFIRLWHRHMNLWLLTMPYSMWISNYVCKCLYISKYILEIVIFWRKIFNLKLFSDKNIFFYLCFLSIASKKKRRKYRRESNMFSFIPFYQWNWVCIMHNIFFDGTFAYVSRFWYYEPFTFLFMTGAKVRVFGNLFPSTCNENFPSISISIGWHWYFFRFLFWLTIIGAPVTFNLMITESNILWWMIGDRLSDRFIIHVLSKIFDFYIDLCF